MAYKLAGPSQIRDMYDKGRKHVEPEVQRYWINLSYLYGEQWVYFNSAHSRVEQLPRQDPKRVRTTVNRLRPETRRIIAKLTKRDLIFAVAPTAADDATVRAARIAEAVLGDYQTNQNWELARRENAYATWVGGTGLLCLDWNPRAGEPVGQDQLGGTISTGDIAISSLTIAEVATVPGARDIETAPYWIKAQALPPEIVKEYYGLKKTPSPDATLLSGPVQNRILTGDRHKPTNLTLVLTYYERPCPDYPQGHVCVVVGSEKIAQGPWPFPFKDRLNVVATREMLAPGRWTGDTVYSDAVPIQTAYNASWSSIIEHMKLAGNARLQVPDTSVEMMDLLTDTPGEIIPYNSQSGQASYLSPPQMPAWWIEQPMRLEQAMNDVLGVHDVSRGQAPRNIESGLGLSILAENDETPVGGLAKELALAWGRLTSLVLQTLAVRVSEPRTARVSHFNQPDETVRWTGRELMNQTNAYVPADSVAVGSDAARKAQGFALWDRKVIDDPRALAAYIDMGQETNFIEATNPDVAKARRENHELATGEPVIPATFDQHQTHIEEHNRFRKTARYERLGDQERNLVDTHIQAHETYAAELMGRQMGRMPQNPALAAAAQGDQPPGSMGGPPLPPGALSQMAMAQVPPPLAEGPQTAPQGPQEPPQGPPQGPPPEMPPPQGLPA